MKKQAYATVLAILLLAAIAGMMSYLPARNDITLGVPVSRFPMQVGDWYGKDLPLTEKDYQILETRNLFVREYKNSQGDAVYLYIIYSEDNRKVSHPPEVCYMGSGATITEKDVFSLTSTIQANSFLTENSAGRQLVVYWFKAGGAYTYSYLWQQSKVVLDRLIGKRTAGAMIRLSANVGADGPKAARERIRSFTREIEPLVAKYVP